MDDVKRDFIEEYHANLLEILKRGEVITDIDLVTYKPKPDRAKNLEKIFLKEFNAVKKRTVAGTKGHNSLSTKAKANLKKLVKRKFGAEEFRKAAIAMYFSNWALSTGNDNPTHLLREENFERYLNLFEKKEQEKAAKKEEQLNKKKTPGELEIEDENKRVREFEKEAIEYYNLSLARKVWLGSPYHSSILILKLKVKLSTAEEVEIRRQAEREARTGRYRGFIGITTERVYKDLVITEAVKQKTKILD